MNPIFKVTNIQTEENERRKFMKALGIASLSLGCPVVAHAMGKKRPTSTQPPETTNSTGSAQDVLVVVFLRGGADGLSFICPSVGANKTQYESARPNLKLVDPIPLLGKSSNSGKFAINKACTNLESLFRENEVVAFHGSGSNSETRSHFIQQDYIEQGATMSSDGYLNRALGLLAQKSSALPAVTINSNLTRSLIGGRPAIAIDSIGNSLKNLKKTKGEKKIESQLSIIDRLKISWTHYQEQESSTLNRAENQIKHAGTRAIKAVDSLEAVNEGGFSSNADYGGLTNFKTAAKLICHDPQTRFVTLDVNSWDTHFNMGPNEGGGFYNKLSNLDKALGAFRKDLRDKQQWHRVTVVVMTEFGRPLHENGTSGLDHGRGGLMLVLGKNIHGSGRVITSGWSLAQEQLIEGRDIKVTIDYRAVIAEILSKRMGLNSSQITQVFPNYSYDSNFIPFMKG